MHSLELVLLEHEDLRGRLRCLIDSFTLEMGPNSVLNGTFAISETFPDNGGLQMSRKTFHKHLRNSLKSGPYNSEQIFTLA